MPRRTVTEEFLSNLGLAEAKEPEKDPMSTLSGEGSSFYAMDGEIDAGSLENKKLFDRDNLSYPIQEDARLRQKMHKSAIAPVKSKEDKKVPEPA